MAERDLTRGLKILDNIRVVIAGDEHFYKVVNRDTLFYRDEHHALAAGDTESYTEITPLNPPTGQLYQIYGIEISGNVEIFMKQPAATNRWGTQRSPEGGPLSDNMSPKHVPEFLNICQRLFPSYPKALRRNWGLMQQVLVGCTNML